MKKVEPKVELINYTQDAIDLLVFTKSSRLKPGTTYAEVCAMKPDDKHDHLEYMFDTIQTSFEFIHYAFHLSDVSRMFTQQLERTRDAAYQEQSLRAVDASGFDVLQTTDHPSYDLAVMHSMAAYAEMIDQDVPVQDARGVLPLNILTQISFSVNLRTLARMAELRLCTRTQGEYQNVFKMMIQKIIDVHPWAKRMLEVYCVKYAICAFPRYEKCPIQKYCFVPSTIRDRIRDEWENCNHKANPRADKYGNTM